MKLLRILLSVQSLESDQYYTIKATRIKEVELRGFEPRHPHCERGTLPTEL